MTRVLQIAAVLDSRLQIPGPRRLTCALCLLSSVLLVFCLAGCSGPKEEPIWEKVKIGDLAPYHGDKPTPAPLRETVKLDVHVFEVPAENIGKLDKISKTLFVQPLRLSNYPAFNANSFSVRFGQLPIWDEIITKLLDTGGQKVTEVSLILADGQAETIAVAGLNRTRTIFYSSIDSSTEGANVGPGVLGLRIKAEKIRGSRGVCDVVAYPVFSLPIRSAIPQLSERGKSREFPFTAAAFGLKMGPGDFVLLAPKKYITDQATLAGLFFSNPRGTLFLYETKRKPPERKPAVRIFLLLCNRVNY